jgi:hypothetical protein
LVPWRHRPLNADDDAISISSRLIENFKVGSSQTRFGDFEFVGGLELSSSSSFLGAMSAIRLAELTETGFSASWIRVSGMRDGLSVMIAAG